MSGLILWGNGARKAGPGYELGFDVGELAAIGERNKADVVLKMVCEAKVTNTSGGALSALNSAQQLAFLDSHTLDLRYDGSRQQAVTTEDGDNPLHTHQGTPFTKLNRIGKRVLEKALVGLGDTTTGLQQPLASGVTTLKYTVYVSLGHVQFLEDDSAALWGVGPDMLALMKLKVKTTSDYLKTVNAGLTLTELAVTFSSLRKKAKGSRISLPPMFRKYTPAAQKQDVKTVEGVVLEAVDTAQPLASRALGALTVQVGDDVVTKPPQTPDDIDAVYSIASDVNAAVEGTISATVTPILVYANTRLAAIPGGALLAIQETYLQQWFLEAVIKPSLTARQLMSYLRRIAMENLTAGQAMHFTNTAPLAGLDDLPDAMLSAAGVTAFRTTEAEANAYPGVRIDKKGEMELYTAPAYLDEAAKAYAVASRDTTANPAGNAAGMDAAVNSYARWFPTAMEDVVNGFPQTGSSAGGAQSATFTLCRKLVSERATAF